MTISNNFNAANSCQCSMPIMINHKRSRFQFKMGGEKNHEELKALTTLNTIPDNNLISNLCFLSRILSYRTKWHRLIWMCRVGLITTKSKLKYDFSLDFFLLLLKVILMTVTFMVLSNKIKWFRFEFRRHLLWICYRYSFCFKSTMPLAFIKVV